MHFNGQSSRIRREELFDRFELFLDEERHRGFFDFFSSVVFFDLGDVVVVVVVVVFVPVVQSICFYFIITIFLVRYFLFLLHLHEQTVHSWLRLIWNVNFRLRAD